MFLNVKVGETEDFFFFLAYLGKHLLLCVTRAVSISLRKCSRSNWDPIVFFRVNIKQISSSKQLSHQLLQELLAVSCRIPPSVSACCWPASEEDAAGKEICSRDIKTEVSTCIPLDTNITFVIKLSEQLPDSKNPLQKLLFQTPPTGS